MSDETRPVATEQVAEKGTKGETAIVVKVELPLAYTTAGTFWVIVKAVRELGLE